ncbi:MAG TPA: hypothetical protein VGP72_14595 [Planctomycetota bacterium]|jgi:hypothetical protein
MNRLCLKCRRPVRAPLHLCERCAQTNRELFGPLAEPPAVKPLQRRKYIYEDRSCR